jgi:hypothetical protein
MSNIETKINDISNLTKSEHDRMFLKEQVFDDLITFLQSHIKKISAKNALREALEIDLAGSINPESEVDADGNLIEGNRLTNFEKIKLLEILSRNEVDSTTALVKAIGESSKNQNMQRPEGNSNENTQKAISENTSQEDIDSAKRVLKHFDKILQGIEKQEFSEEEKK